MRVRTNYIYQMRYNDKVAKALAVSLYVKKNFQSSVIKNFSYNKLHEKTGLHISTLKKRIKTLQELKLVKFIGDNNQHLLFKSIASRTSHCNVYLSTIDTDNIKDIERNVYALVVALVVRNKEFARHSIQSANNPTSYEEMKKARKICKRYGYGRNFEDNGVSYKTLAKYMGVCLQKAFNIVKYAVKQGLIVQTKRVKHYYLKNAKKFSQYMNENNFTFATDNNIYIVNACIYSTPSNNSYAGNI